MSYTREDFIKELRAYIADKINNLIEAEDIEREYGVSYDRAGNETVHLPWEGNVEDAKNMLPNIPDKVFYTLRYDLDSYGYPTFRFYTKDCEVSFWFGDYRFKDGEEREERHKFEPDNPDKRTTRAVKWSCDGWHNLSYEEREKIKDCEYCDRKGTVPKELMELFKKAVC